MSGQVFLGAADYSVGEREPFVTVTIKRSGDLSGTATVSYATNVNTATEGSDYRDTDGSATFAAGQSTITVNIPIINDSLSETTERFNFSLVSTDASTTILFPRTATVSILDDENPVTDPAQPPLTSPYTVTTTTVLAGLEMPMALEYLPGTNKAFMVEKTGTIKFVDMSTGTVQSTVLDIRDKVNGNADRGLMDIALHPDLANNPYLYAFYVVDPAGTASGTGGAVRDGEGNRYVYLSRFTLDLSGATPRIVAGSEVVLMGGAGQSLADISGGGVLNFTDQAYANNRASDVNADGSYKQNYLKVDSQSHVGGAIAFGPDGKLYVSTGDGASFDYADPRTKAVQDVGSLSGKILRIDPITGQGLSDNPYATGDLSANASKVWASGLRNPYSMTFADDGRLFISETGWYSWEEINVGAKGANYGWPFYEGGDNGVLLKTPAYQNQAAAIDFYAKVASGQVTVTPAYRAFGHADADPGYQFSAIVGASTIYTGDKYPAAFQNDYFFTDIVDGEIYSIDINDRTKAQFVTDIGAYGPSNFIQGPDGYMYLMDLVNGRILRLNITDPNAGQNHAPTVNAPIADQAATAGTAFSYVVPANTFADSDGDTLTLTARQSNGATLPAWLTFNAATGTFTGTPPAGTSGTVTVRVTATDPGALATSDDFIITVGNGTTPETVVNDIANQNQFPTGATANDVFRYAGASTLYDWGPTADGAGIVVWTRSTSDNTYDVLVGFEKLRFSDRTIDLVPQNGPDYVDVPEINQQLTGKTSADRFIVNGPSTAYQWGPTNDGTGIVIWTTSTTDDTYDILKGFEQIVFTDRVVTLSGAPPANSAPVVANPIADQAATIGTAFSFVVPANTFTDPDGDALTRTATLTGGAALPSWLTFTAATGTFSGTPPAGSAGQLAINVTVNDGNTHTATDTFLLTIGGGTANHAPTLANPIVDQAGTEDATFTFTLPANTFADQDGDTLLRTATMSNGTQLPFWLSFNAQTGTFTGTPSDRDVGTHVIMVTATDPSGLTVTDTFNLTIAGVNDAPRLGVPFPDQSGTAGTAINFTVPTNTFTDADNDTLAFSAKLADGSALPSWLSFNATTRTFTGTAPAGATLDIAITGTDPGGLSATDTFRLSIAAATTEKLYQNTTATQILTGDTANDVFVLGGSSTGYQWGPTQDGNGIVIWNSAGYDILFGFEQLRFTNKSVSIAASSSNVVQDDPELVQHLTGKGTNDIFAIDGPSTDYQWGKTAAGTGIVIWTVSAADDTYDILNGFEKIQFTDQTVDVSGLVT
ncbi:MAG TPA: putative Ig domain-containing protein [Devosia sp.]|nr:putative Ig domain-containing protein [Devosia sp.]